MVLDNRGGFMLMFCLKVIITSIPIVFAGISNMVFVKSKRLAWLSVPLDHGQMIKGKRIFGDNKTYKGIVGMMLFTGFYLLLFSLLCHLSPKVNSLILFDLANHSYLASIIYGLLWGLGYCLFELPNSFIKRRFDIGPGKAAPGGLKYVFLVIDQIDSVFAGLILIIFFYPLTLTEGVLLVIIGGLIHYGVNIWLYRVHLKKQRG